MKMEIFNSKGLFIMNIILKKLVFFITILSLSSFGATAIPLKYTLTPEKHYLHNISSKYDIDEDYTTDEETTYSQENPYPPKGSKERTQQRQEFNHKRITEQFEHVGPFIEKFIKSETPANLNNLLLQIAYVANKAYNAEKVGTGRGTHKHTFCKDFMNEIKRRYPHFPDVRAEHSIGNSRFDVIWIKGKDAYVYDYKFGDTNNTSKPSDSEDYRRDLLNAGYKMVGNINDIHPGK